ncbi:MAG: hypothetical protein E6H84_10155 [Chloroflexi bacterium]|nr:MAG: hypothetical protein E6H84_10155 [Chloroflexota bacterium]
MVVWPHSRSHVALTIAVAILLTFVFGSDATLGPQGRVLATATTVTNLSGSVFIRRAADMGFTPAHVGDILSTGDTIWAGPGTAEVTYFEGSSIGIGAETQLVVQPLVVDGDADAVASLSGVFDRTWHAITRLVTGTPRYEIRTPTSSATIRG